MEEEYLCYVGMYWPISMYLLRTFILSYFLGGMMCAEIAEDDTVLVLTDDVFQKALDGEGLEKEVKKS